jgi:phage gpG-like protein
MAGKIERIALERANKKMDDMADFIFSRSQENVAQLSDTGELLSSGHVEKQDNKKIIGYSAAHAVFIEFGTHPHMPPVEAIKDWVGRKGLAQDEKELNAIGWAIAMKIKAEGTDPHPFLRPALNEALLKFKL